MKQLHYPIAISLVTYNGKRWLKFCLESLLKQTRQDFFLMIIDNGSMDGTTKFINNFLQEHSELYKHSRLVDNRQNLLFAKAHNQAIAWTDSEYVLLLNQDVILDSNYLAETAALLAQRPEAAAVSGKILRWNFQSSTFHFNDLANLQKVSQVDTLGLKIFRSRSVVNISAGKFDNSQQTEPTQVFGVAGTAPLYRRLALETIAEGSEVLDQDFVMYKEDVDLAWRLQLAGFESWYVPKAIAYHDRSLGGTDSWRQQISQRKNWSQDLKIYSWVNHWATIIKNDTVVNVLLDLPWILVAEGKKMAYYLLFEPITLVKGIVRLVKLYPKFLAKRQAQKVTRKLRSKEIRKWWS